VADDGTALIHARGLTKRFGSFTAVDAVDFDVQRGEAFGFLGPNGAGKSSTMRMIGCVSPVTEGVLRVLGMDPAADGPRIRARLGVVPQEDTLDVELTVRENLLIYGRYFDLPRSVVRERADALLEFVQLDHRANERVDPLSGGLKRRLTIARALVSEPELLLLDEPTTGLDPQARHAVWDRLVVMDNGRIVADGTPRDLIARYSTREVLELRLPPAEADAALARLDGSADRVEVLPDRVLLYTDDGEEALAKVHGFGIQPDSALVRRSSLEDVFLHLTGRTLVD
jgi:lipooligosaccharide transport system ATP-binding protein